MASRPGPLTRWPWEVLGLGSTAKYAAIFGPLVLAVALGKDDADNFCKHMLLLAFLRYALAEVWLFASRCHALTEKIRIVQKPITFEQIDREDHWDDYILLQVAVISLFHYCVPGFHGFPLWSTRGCVQMILLHVGPTEFIYYWLHRLLHNHTLYAAYHSHHHASFVTEPVTGSVHPFLEHVAYTANFAIPLVGTWLAGGASMGMFYAYLLGFDFLNEMGHCNFEFMPLWLMRGVPGLKYIIYTPSFHSLHHTKVTTNYALFMPLYDHIYGTADKASDSLHAAVRSGKAFKAAGSGRTDFVFLAHGTDPLSVFHLPFLSRAFAAAPYAPRWWLVPLFPLALPALVVMQWIGRAVVADKHRLGEHRLETWAVPRFGYQYLMKRNHASINAIIERSILAADAAGAKVIGLGALNKAENVNGGGVLFTRRHPGLRVRVTHGNTLTAACVLRELPPGVAEVFLTGATSKLGRAIALYLAARGTRVLMMTSAVGRYEAIRDEAPEAHRHLLVRAAKLAEGAHCKTWVVGKYLWPRDQTHAPPGTHFHQFVVPCIPASRGDCTYGTLAAMRLPEAVAGLKSCEMSMQRNAVHACHAGALVHLLEGWTHHEVGAIDPLRIDLTWDAAMKHGFKHAL